MATLTALPPTTADRLHGLPRLHAWYERNLTRGIQPARWIEYSLSSSLMMVVIAMLVGIYDIASLILIFALNMLLQYRRVGRWRDYLYGERVYMLLSLFAKSALAWQVFAGTLQPA
jgi:hypothetical protein